MAEKRTKRLGSIVCPACGHRMAPLAIHDHTESCVAWREKYGPSLPYFKWDRHAKRELFAEGAVEGIDYLQCKECLKFGWDFRFSRLTQHLRDVHGLSDVEYLARYDSPIRLDKTYERRVGTVQNRYGVDNVFQLEETKEKARLTALERYGVEKASNNPDANKKRAETNLARFGHENPFGGSEGIIRVRRAFRIKYGVDNPQQVAEIRERTLATCEEKYGSRFFVTTEEFKQQSRKTSLEKWGVPHHMKNKERFAKFKENFKAKYGVDNPLLIHTIWKKTYTTNLANHGGKHSQQCSEVRDKARKTWLEKYGVDNPSKCAEILARIKASVEKTCLERYGVPYCLPIFGKGPNKLEQLVDNLSPGTLVFAGGGEYWVGKKGEKRVHNPDFVVLKREQLVAYKNGTPLNDLRTSAVCEIFGDYWHGPEKTGKSRIAHRNEVERFYEDQGITCLVLWEHEINKNPKRIAERIKSFIAKWRRGGYRNLQSGPNILDFLCEP